MKAMLRSVFIFFSLVAIIYSIEEPTNACADSLEGAFDGELDASYSGVDLDRFQRPAPDDASYNHIAQLNYKKSNARYLRIELAQVKLQPGDRITISGKATWNASSHPNKVIINSADLSEEGSYISPIILGDVLNLKLDADKISMDRIIIKELYYEYRPTLRGESIFGSNDMQQIYKFSSDASLWSEQRSIVFLSFIVGKTMRMCSGFVINHDMIMTNNHCISNQSICDTTNVVFDYIKDEDSHITIGAQTKCKEIVKTDYALDYTVFRVSDSIQPDIVPIPLSSGDVYPNEVSVLVEHPGGEPKQADASGCEVLEVGEPGREPAVRSDFTHRCDTINGSSGSPVLSKLASGETEYCAIGLHHLGFDTAGRFLTRNRAVSMSPILLQLLEAGVATSDCLPSQ